MKKYKNDLITSPNITNNTTEVLPFQLNFNVYDFYKNIQVETEVETEVKQEVIPEVKQEIKTEVEQGIIQLIKSTTPIPSINLCKQLVQAQDITFKCQSDRFPFEYGESKKIRIKIRSNTDLCGYFKDCYMQDRIHMNLFSEHYSNRINSIINVVVNKNGEINQVLLISDIFISACNISEFDTSTRGEIVSFEVLFNKMIRIPISILHNLEITDKDFIVKDERGISIMLLVSKNRLKD